MIPTKSRRLKAFRLPKVLERQYKQTKCRDCTVVVTPMDFAKILGKFTKVKIQFESNSPKIKRTVQSSPNARLKNNENGMVQVHRSAYNPHPARKLLGTGKKTKINEILSTRQTKNNQNTLSRQTTKNNQTSPRQNTKSNQSPLTRPLKKNEITQQSTFNVLKENNKVKKLVQKNLQYNIKKPNSVKSTHYSVVFVNPTSIKKDVRSKINLDNLLPNIDKNILPSEEWIIDYFPKKGEPKDDKIYDRIAAELEDLMYNEKTKNSSDNKDGKNDEFPSILDILNDNPKAVTEKNVQISNEPLESSDVEAMLLGKSKSSEPLPMDIVTPNVINNEGTEKIVPESVIEDNPESPSILEEPEPKDVPVLSVAEKPLTPNNITSETMHSDENDNTHTRNQNDRKSGVTQVIFKKTKPGCSKTVVCLKNLKYNILIQGKTIELLGAPKVISCLEDLQVLLQIVDESELSSLYLLH